jgi:glycosyltransferase involved in cell wall biosynthesis
VGRLGVPFIFGPVGGGEAAPYPLRKEYGFSGWIKDFLRDAANAFARIDPLMRYTYKTSARIFVTSEQTKRMIPERFQDKTTIRLAIGLDRPVVEATHRYPSPGNLLKILYVGRFLYWKGMTLGIKSFARLIRSGISAELTFVGQGPETSRMKTLAAHLGISKKIRWISWVERKNLKDLYKAHDLFLFPSFHDSGGMVVLEAMSHGLPVVCLDLGGPGVMVDETCGIKIPVSGKNSREVVQSLCSAMVAINRDKLLFSDLSLGAGERARSFALKETIAQFNADILEAICRR